MVRSGVNRQTNRRWDERLALEVIKRVERLGQGDWEWITPGNTPTPDLRIKTLSALVEITSHVASDQKQYWDAMRMFEEPQPVPGLTNEWTLLVMHGPSRIRDSLKRVEPVLREIEARGGSPADMLREAKRRFNPRPYLDNRAILHHWYLKDETGRPPLGQWLKSRIDYWYPEEIARVWQGRSDYPFQTVFADWEPVPGGGSIRLYGSSGMGFDLVGEELLVAVQHSIDKKHLRGQLNRNGYGKWLVVVLDRTEAYHQFVAFPEKNGGHWSHHSPSLFESLNYRDIDQVWIVALSDRTGDVFYLRLPASDPTPQRIRISRFGSPL